MSHPVILIKMPKIAFETTISAVFCILEAQNRGSIGKKAHFQGSPKTIHLW